MSIHNGGLRYRVIVLFACVLTSFTLTAQNWTINIATVGSFSSPRITDLNNDGVKDIVMGAGRLEFQASDTAVIALDGKDGSMLWNVSAIDQIFGSAMFLDVTDDQIKDIFIGGRSAELIAINGANGNVLWRFTEQNIKDNRWFNFYNPQLVADQDGDGYRDLLVTNGGDVMVEPHDANRPAGYLMVISAKTGKLLSSATMPDGRETYISPVVLNGNSNEGTKIIYGTGGETVGGGLFVSTLADVMNGDLSSAITLDTASKKGYIGPPVCVDLNRDDVLDIVANAVDGRLVAIDGSTYKQLWQVVLPNTESYSSVCLGKFTDDDVPDVFVSYGQGVWPDLDWSIQMMVNGLTGEIEFRDSLGFYQNTTPLAVDMTGDGRDEVIMSLNYQEINEFYQKYFYTKLIVIEFGEQEIVQLTNQYEGSNLSSTPWIGDIDNNGFLDLIYCHGTSLRHTYSFDGMNVHRLDTQIPMHGTLKWGSYQGSNYDGIYRQDGNKK